MNQNASTPPPHPASPLGPASPTAPDLPEIDHFGEPLEWLIPIPIQDNGEKLVDIFDFSEGLRWMETSPRFDFERFGTAREGVAKMLANAQSLLPSGLHLQIVGAFRPFQTQKAMYEIVFRETQEKYPHWDAAFVEKYVNVFSAPPIWDTPPPHTTGGAVDLSIVDASGERLDMVSPFEMGWDSAPTFIAGLSETARHNRDLLIGVLSEVGLTNFRGEWWHWSYGEPGWALRGGHPVALYGAVPEDQIPSWTPPQFSANTSA